MFIIYEVRLGTEELTEAVEQVHMDTSDGDMDYAEAVAIKLAQFRAGSTLEKPTYIATSILYKEGQYRHNFVPPTCENEFWDVLKPLDK
jgi:hypothetical protein